MASLKEIYGRLFDTTVRVEAAWPFPVSPASDSLTEALEDCDGRLPAEIAALIERWSESERDELFGGPSPAAEEAFSELCGEAFRKGVFGWLAIVATPVVKPYADRKGGSCSWGHYHTTMIFAATGEELLVRAAEWAEGQFAADMAKAAA